MGLVIPYVAQMNPTGITRELYPILEAAPLAVIFFELHRKLPFDAAFRFARCYAVLLSDVVLRLVVSIALLRLPDYMWHWIRVLVSLPLFR